MVELTKLLSKFDAYFGNGIRCMKGRLLRGKTSREDDILFMIHATDWTICPIHSFASLLACNNITLKLYPFISQSRGSDNVNLLLKRKCREHDSLTPKLTSKCFNTLITNHFNRNANSTDRDTAVLAEVSTHFPPELLSRKSLPISDFFLRWYKQELYNINCQSDEESRSFNLFKNAIRLLKRFLPDNSILEKRPISDHTSLRAWLHNLGRLSATIEDRSLAFCEQHKKPNNNPVRQRKLQPFFEGIYKRLNELSFDRRVQFPTPVGVVDRCMPNEMNSTV